MVFSSHYAQNYAGIMWTSLEGAQYNSEASLASGARETTLSPGQSARSIRGRELNKGAE